MDDSPWGEHYEAPRVRKRPRVPKPPREPRDPAETILTSYGAEDLPIVILVFALHIVLIITLTFMGVVSAFIGDACGERDCNYGVMEASGWLIIIGPWVLFAAFVLFAGRRRLRGHTAWWVPLIAIAATILLFMVSELMLYAGADQLFRS